MWLDGLAALVTGILSGWGVGGGALLMIYMTAFAGVHQLTAAGINLLYFIPAAGTALVWHGRNRQIEWPVVWPAIAAGLVTSGLCAIFVHGIDNGLLRMLFGVFLCYIGVSELFRKSK